MIRGVPQDPGGQVELPPKLGDSGGGVGRGAIGGGVGWKVGVGCDADGFCNTGFPVGGDREPGELVAPGSGWATATLAEAAMKAAAVRARRDMITSLAGASTPAD